MATYKAGKVTITYNGVDVTEQFTNAAADWAEQHPLTPTYAIDVDFADKRPALDMMTSEQRFSFDLTMGLWLGTVRIVRVRPAAPIRACAMHRHPGCAATGKRGHIAHRGR